MTNKVSEIFTAITIRQPWAYLIAEGVKTVENRTWTTQYRGPLVIVAGKKIATTDWCDIIDECDLIFGAAIALVDIVDIDRKIDNEFAEGPWCWRLRNPRKIRPVPIRGQLGLFKINLLNC